jgi:hypothetical protein
MPDYENIYIVYIIGYITKINALAGIVRWNEKTKLS